MTDSASPPARSRRSLLFEGLTIVLSILLAFAIDAWWDTSREREANERRLQALATELFENRARLEGILERGERSHAASRALIDVVGPTTQPVPEDSLGMLIGASWSTGIARMETAVASSILASGDFAEEGSVALLGAISAFRGLNEKYVNDGDLFDQARDRVLSHVETVVPGAWASAGAGDHATTDFPANPQRLQHDPRFEALVGTLAVRTRVLNRDVEQLLAMVDSVGSLIESRR